jgi:hypothetical protein
MGSMIVWTCVGIFLGWVVIPQPAWAALVWNKAKTTVSGWFNKEA